MVMTHTFTLSGLGEAPFSLVHPGDPKAQENQAFFCEHCGTGLKNRFFVKSADGKVSVVGIDCLNKTGDQGLMDGEKRLRRQLRQEERQAKTDAKVAQLEAEDRKKFGGKSREQVIAGLEGEIKDLKDRHYEVIYDHEATQALRFNNTSDFVNNMLQRAFDGESFSKGMMNALVDVLAKKKSGARKNSKAYKAALPDAEALISSLLVAIETHAEKVEALEGKIRDLKAHRE